MLLRQIASTEETDPVVRVLAQTAPAAGADISITVPGQSVWQLVALTGLLTPDNNATARGVAFTVTDGSTIIGTFPAGATIAASTATQVTLAPGAGYTQTTAVGAALTVGVPPLILTAGWQLKTATTAIHSGDQWSGVVLTVLEVFIGTVEHERMIARAILDRLEAIERLATGTL